MWIEIYFINKFRVEYITNLSELHILMFLNFQYFPTSECLNEVKSSECLDCQNQPDLQDRQDNTSC